MGKLSKSPHSVVGVFAVLLVGVLCQSSGAENPALQYMANEFTELPFSTITLVTTLPSLMMLPAALGFSALRRRFSFRSLFIAGSVLLIAGGVAPYWTKTFTDVLVWRGVFGLGVGIMWPLAQSMIVELYDGNKQDTLLGWNSVVTALGGIIWANVGGILALQGWRTAFLTYLIPIAVLVFSGVFMPSSKPLREEKKPDNAQGSVNAGLIGLTVAILIGYFLYNFCNMTYFTNIAAKVVGEGIGDSAAVGLASSFYTVGSLVIGVFFGKAMRNKWFSKYSVAVGWIASAIGMLITGLTPTYEIVLVGSAIQGFGTGTFMPSMVGIIGNVAGKQNASLILGISMCLVGAAQFFGPSIFNIIAEAAGLAAGSACITISATAQLVFAIAGTVFLVCIRTRKRKETN
ncbi:MFS transporter [Ellagibacter isourolithinifaciens]|uniref:MFS transporter n=1 Tax=Ellagibacter isourolithinifaciens TaxID=2137581 RepID=UPI002E7808F4|nr:MFS transporter [Ellagibacter isourolithinifaciens]